MSKALLEHKSVRVKLCRYGYMAYFATDEYIGRSLDIYGEYSQQQVFLIDQLIDPGDLVIDAGANIGAITLPMAKKVGRHGRVIAIEPSPEIFGMLNANLALNSLWQVTTLRYALGDQVETAKLKSFDWEKRENFGRASVENDPLAQDVQVIPLDALQLKTCKFMKVDIEGSEVKFIRGAQETIRRCRPFIYIENDRRENSSTLIEQLQALEYNLYWSCTKLFYKDNFFDNKEDVFGECYSVDMLCIPNERMQEKIFNLRPVLGPFDTPL